MAINTYATLKSAVAAYLNRSDLTTYIPDFITLGVSRIYYGSEDTFASKPLRIPAMQTQATGTISSSSISFPSDFLEVIRLAASSGGETWTLDYTTPSAFSKTSNSSGLPTEYTFLNNAIKTAGTGAASYILDYYKIFTAFSGDSDTNWLLTNAPQVYLYSALIEASPFIMDDARIQGWYSLYKSAISGLNRSTQRHGTAPQAKVVK